MAIMPVGALPPGPYVARAIISSNGKTVGKLTRPFIVAPGTRTAAPQPSAAAAAVATPVAAPATSGILIGARPATFNPTDVLKADMLKAVFDVMEKTHPTVKNAFAKARNGQFEGTALMALDAGDQAAGSVLRGLEFFSKGQLNPAATQFGVALRSPADSAIASFYLGACFAAAGRDKDAVAAWERVRASQLAMPNLHVVLADGWLRMGQPAQALDPLKEALDKQPQNDGIRKNLAIAQSQMAMHEQAYGTITPYLERNSNDADALMVALHALYQVRVAGKSLGTAEEDKARAAQYARAYIAAKGPLQALVEKWAEFLAR
jgi:tetratricopeptide (TPR) repeat protein